MSLESAFAAVGYTSRRVRISDLLANSEYQFSGSKGPEGEGSRACWLMDLGDGLRRQTKSKAAAAVLAMTRIRAERESEMGSPKPGQRLQERSGVVTIIRSVKRPEELEELRLTYGSRLLVLGVSASETQRLKSLTARLRKDHPGRDVDWYVGEATRLMRRDQKDDEDDMGQSFQKAFTRCDAYVWLRPGHDSNSAVARIVRVWFGEPFTTPSLDEQAMYHAFSAQFRSAAAGRQVGAAVVDASGEVLVTGTNDVPKPGGGQYWPGDEHDLRDYALEFEMNDRLKYELVADVMKDLEPWFKKKRRARGLEGLIKDALAGPLKRNRLRDLIEFGRIMHAEMAAICTAARRGTPIGGSDLFTTTYPCHECARLIIGAGIRRVVFIDPYPKSQVSTLFEGQVSAEISEPGPNNVPFVPFEGVAPVLFPHVFAMHSRERSDDGTFEAWVPETLAERQEVPELALEEMALKGFQKTYRRMLTTSTSLKV
ncbi:deaminase [Nocardioides sp.]|uniref:deaminase n=1 Tax=Nocardioides sp. TaxID=35761 RepID=UPI00271B505A|nr:deaminase [Nocardioides sp.]MDO9455265.1 deaminase [Nocardioides sp.]